MERFDITFFEGPGADYVVKDEVIADMAASGMTLSQLWFTYDVKTNIKALKLLEKYNMKAVVYEKRLLALYDSRKIEDVDRIVKEVVDDYKDYYHIITGWEIADEPNTEGFEILAKIVEALKKYVPQHEAVINLYPNYASNEMLKADSYVDYVERYINEVKPDFISYDYYPFTGRETQQELGDINSTSDEREKAIRAAAMRKEDRVEYFLNLEIIREQGLKNDLEQVLIVQLLEHGVYRNLSYEEILWQVNMCLAYGMHRISYFTYWDPMPDDFWKWEKAMCDRKGNKYQHYYDVQRANKEIYEIGKKLFRTKSKEVFHIGTNEQGTREFEEYGNIQKINGERGVIGFFEDGHFYIVNHDYCNERDFEIVAAKNILLYENEQYIERGEKFIVNLKPGQGKLLKMDC